MVHVLHLVFETPNFPSGSAEIKFTNHNARVDYSCVDLKPNSSGKTGEMVARLTETGVDRVHRFACMGEGPVGFEPRTPIERLSQFGPVLFRPKGPSSLGGILRSGSEI